jgi:hypothetical protein
MNKTAMPKRMLQGKIYTMKREAQVEVVVGCI